MPDIFHSAAIDGREDSPLRRLQVQITSGTASDHRAVESLLAQAFVELRPELRQAIPEHPGYEPCDRLLAKRQGQVVGHILVSPRVWRLAPLAVRTSHLSWLAIDAAVRRLGLGTELVLRAERQAIAQGSLLATVWCRNAGFWQRHGYVACTQRDSLQAHAHHLLANLPNPNPQYSIRPWRRSEGAAILELHAAKLQSTWGAFSRSEAVWQWLIGNRANRIIYVATEGPERRRGGPEVESLAGYLVLDGDRIVEHACRGDEADVLPAMLSRVCRDAVERGEPLISLVRPAGESLEASFAATQIRHHPPHAILMAKALDLPKLLTTLAPPVLAAARDAGWKSTPLGIDVEGIRGQWIMERRRPRFALGHCGRSYFSATAADLLLWLLGNVSGQELLRSGRIKPSTQVAGKYVQAVLPSRACWISGMDDLMHDA